ncbi:MAG: bifunctional fucokinase/L-fucose-1-P-guanylyltransferase [Proteobacteria bacterium]|nr:bifunctional fucokinase/L-fucose-1-P-guanylyltransferase [Pseudomonadota bacterium]
MNQNDFFAQSESDALRDFEDSCRQTRDGSWDWVVLTAANAHQAETYRIQLEKRRQEHRLPLNTQFLVVPDFEDKRVGSGGATLNVLRELAQKQRPSQIFEQRILVIHSGGDSKRIPQYSACGKLFAPVPRQVLGGYVSTLFDELLMSAINIPSRTGHGMLILPSDTKLLFNAVQIDLLSCDAAGLSMKAPVAVGQEHGVFVQGDNSFDHRNRNVSLFLHKQPEAFLRQYGAVDISNQVDIDTGCIWLGKRVVKALFDLISGRDGIDEDRFRMFVNPKVCLNFYADMVYPLAENSSWEEFAKEAPENGFSRELEQCRRILWETLHSFRLSLVKLVPAQYIHFGMTHEMYDLYVNDIDSYQYLLWQRRMNTNAESGTVLNSIFVNNRMAGEQAYIENCRITDCTLGEGVILSHVDIQGECIPPSVVLHGLKLTSGRYVCRIYGRNDNPKSSKESSFLKGTLSKLIAMTGVREDEIWGSSSASLWYARIYPICDSMSDAVRAALNLYDILAGTASAETIEIWKKAQKTSLAESFLSADIEAILNRQDEIQTEVHIKRFMDDLRAGRDMHECIDVLGQNVRDKIKCLNRIVDAAKSEQFPNNMRLFLAASRFCQQHPALPGALSPQLYEDDAYECIKQCVIEETYARFGIRPADIIHFVQDEVTTELPVRVNFCGSPSDAAPYCLEHGGTMIDGTLLLRGKKPIRVTVRRLAENCIRLGSLDQDRNDDYYDIEDIRRCGDPGDPHALHKAVLVACGLVPLENDGMTMLALCEKIGGGLELLTAVDVPKGSGLGTSSILAAAALQAVHRALGIDASDEMIYAQVFLVEQLMNTGGGWQDQVGGLTPGIKYFSARAGRYQKMEIEKLALSDDTFNELNDRFCLIFSGQRRLARNVLREEMNQCICNDKNALETVLKIQEYCAVMRFYLLRGDITAFARYITKQFELVKTLDKGASNTYIEYIFESCRDLLDGWSICGAGGGGFLQVILKKGVDRQMLARRIHETFIDCGVDVWDCTLI